MAGMLRDGKRAAAGDVGHEKGGAVITRPGELLAAADVVVAVPEQEVRCLVSSCRSLPCC